jgi:4-hydroxy-2-oxoheptanedioate aldolase
MALSASAGVQPIAQQNIRLNHIIENLEQGKPVILEQDFRFLDMEHGPFQMDRLESSLAETGKDRSPDGRLKRPPIARIPQDGDEDFRWAVKQVLDSGVFGIFFPHIESKDQAMKAIRAMRYPPQSYTKQPEPRGERGYGPTRAVRYWGLTLPDYLRKADVWPLNADGELFAVMMIETAAGVQNIKDIVQVPGIGAIMLATMDLTMSLGIGPPPSTDPKLEAAYQTVLKACLEKKTIACGCSDYVDK